MAKRRKAKKVTYVKVRGKRAVKARMLKPYYTSYVRNLVTLRKMKK